MERRHAVIVLLVHIDVPANQLLSGVFVVIRYRSMEKVVTILTELVNIGLADGRIEFSVFVVTNQEKNV
jgi:hypothetical protein